MTYKKTKLIKRKSKQNVAGAPGATRCSQPHSLPSLASVSAIAIVVIACGSSTSGSGAFVRVGTSPRLTFGHEGDGSESLRGEKVLAGRMTLCLASEGEVGDGRGRRNVKQKLMEVPFTLIPSQSYSLPYIGLVLKILGIAVVSRGGGDMVVRPGAKRDKMSCDDSSRDT
jgi:hypothetical protein